MAFDEVKSLREEYEAAQDAAEAKRDVYHAAVRKLYMSGVTLREIAEQLGISHQRVHKIVGIEPAHRKKRRMGATIALIFALATTGLLALTSVGAGLAASEGRPDPFFWLTLEEGASDNDVKALEAQAKADSRVAKFGSCSDETFGDYFPLMCLGTTPNGDETMAVKRPPTVFLVLDSFRSEDKVRDDYVGLPQESTVGWTGDSIWEVIGRPVSIGGALAAIGCFILSLRIMRSHFRSRRTTPQSAGPDLTPV